MAASQAYKGRLFCNGYNISDLIRKASVQVSGDVLDTTTFATNGWMEKIRGLKSGAVNCDIIRKGDKASYLDMLNRALGASPNDNVVSFMPEGEVLGNQSIGLRTVITSFGDGGTVNGVVGGSLDFVTNTGMTLSTILHVSSGTDSI